jgi:hypothetical protein
MTWVLFGGLGVFFVAGFVFAAGYGVGYTASSEDFKRKSRLGQIDSGSLRFEVTVHEGHHSKMVYLASSVDPDKTRAALVAVQGGRPFSELGMRGVLSGTEFESLRADLIDRGFADWKNPKARQQGVIFTYSGRALLRAVQGGQL